MGHTELYQVGFQQDGPGHVTCLLSRESYCESIECGVHMLPLSEPSPGSATPALSGQGPNYQDSISESGLVHLTRVTLFSAAWEIGRSCLYLVSILGKGICSAEMRSPAHSPHPRSMQSDVLKDYSQTR